MPSDHVQLCSTSGAHPGMARKVLRAFPAPRRQLRNCVDRVSLPVRLKEHIDLESEESF